MNELHPETMTPELHDRLVQALKNLMGLVERSLPFETDAETVDKLVSDIKAGGIVSLSFRPSNGHAQLTICNGEAESNPVVIFDAVQLEPKTRKETIN